jgi:6-phosphogluconolactonase
MEMSRQVFPDRQALIDGAAAHIAELAANAIGARGGFTLALSGGNTPQPVYSLLATAPYVKSIDWSLVQIFFGDERCVPPDDQRSNYHMARRALLDQVPLPMDNVHRIRGEDNPEEAAAKYITALQKIFGGKSGAGAPDAGFDLILLGMGDNGHTASLFPGLPAVTERSQWVVAQYVEVAGMWRVTMTPTLINAARNVTFLVSGSDKADVLSRVIEGPHQPIVLPSQAIKPANGQLRWFLDAPAAAHLRKIE